MNVRLCFSTSTGFSMMPSLIPYHTFATPAQAKTLLEFTALDELQQAWRQAKAENQPVLFLGQGSNVLFLRDFNGMVLVNRLMGIEHTQSEEHTSELQSRQYLVCRLLLEKKSTRLALVRCDAEPEPLII